MIILKYMRPRYIILCFLVMSLTAPAMAQNAAPGSDIVSRTVLSSDGTWKLVRRVYDNGLGDVVQETESCQGSALPDIVVRHEYDKRRRRTRSWLPVASPSNGGGYVSGATVASLAASQYSDTAPFTRTEYDGFLTSQPSALHKAGAQWQGNGKKTSVTYSEYVGAGMYTDFIEDGCIYIFPDVKYLCTRTVDEDGCQRAEYTDVSGRLAISETSEGRTYYIYDVKGDVKFVIPPALSGYVLNSAYGVLEDTDAMIGKHVYVYRYDSQGRLATANYGESPYLDAYHTKYDEKAEYDYMGNPTWVYRKSPVTLENNRPSSPSDRLRLEYDGNQLVHVTDTVTSGHNYEGAFHFADGADQTVEYEYDANGNMTKDLNRNISSIEYNLLNLPSKISFGNNSYIYNTYSAAGEKLTTQYAIQMLPVLGPLSGNGGTTKTEGVSGPGGTRSGPATPVDTDHRYYCGNVVYDRGVTRLLTDEGYVTFSETGAPVYHYYLRDHLGNIRVVMGQTGTVEQVNHYYAFGGLMRESTSPGLQPYKYGGKELDRYAGLDAYDFGARSFFADRMQWSTMDPLCEKYYDVSPYAYCFDNPVYFFDLKGEDPGDFFYRLDDTAKDFGNYYNGTSIVNNTEYGSSIYLTTDGNGRVGFTYTIANQGDASSVICSEAPKGAYTVAQIHKHANSLPDAYGSEFKNNVFSGNTNDAVVNNKIGNESHKFSIGHLYSANGYEFYKIMLNAIRGK